jgi:hypothetical protein
MLLLLLIICSLYAQAQTADMTVDTSGIVMLREVKVRARFKNDTERYHYNQKKFYVKTILPYLDAATKVFKEMDAKIQDESLSRRARKDYVHSRENEIRTQFEDRVKSLNVTQGALLVTLIARQTEVNIYSILREFKNPLTAVKWQGWARLNGMNLDKKYDPEAEPDLELIMDELGYPLPLSYATNYMK